MNTKKLIIQMVTTGEKSFDELYAALAANGKVLHRDGLESLLQVLTNEKRLMIVDGKWRPYFFAKGKGISDLKYDMNDTRGILNAA